MIAQTVRTALTASVRPPPYVPARPTAITIELATVDAMKRFCGRPGTETIDPLTLIARGETWMHAWNLIWDY
jgi:hypothetical protein